MSDIVFGFVFITFVFLLAVLLVLFVPWNQTKVIITDTGYSIELVDCWGAKNYDIFTESKTIVVRRDGEIEAYRYNDWYVFDFVDGESVWQRLTKK